MTFARSLSLFLVLPPLLGCGGQTLPTGPGIIAVTDAGGSPSDDAAGAQPPPPPPPAPGTQFVTSVQGSGECLPQALQPNANGYITCAILEGVVGATSCDASLGLSEPSAAVAARMSSISNAEGAHLCTLAQLPVAKGGSCASSSSPGWCYVTGDTASQCPQEILFSPGGTPANGVIVWLMC